MAEARGFRNSSSCRVENKLKAPYSVNLTCHPTRPTSNGDIQPNPGPVLPPSMFVRLTFALLLTL